VSRLRARCPSCDTLTAVALDTGYECHACGREFKAGLVRVPRAWGEGGEAMAAAAGLPVPLPEAAVIECGALMEQTDQIAAALPRLPVVLGGCCCAHTGAIRGLSARVRRLGVVWLDAHGDLNTPETSPSGNAWGMPLRAAIDAGDVEARDVALLGARDLDPPEAAFIREHGIGSSAADVLENADAVYVALDADVLDEGVARCFMPVRGGLALADAERVVREVSGRRPVAGIGFTGFVAHPLNIEVIRRLLDAAGMGETPD
jgi:Arginase family